MPAMDKLVTIARAGILLKLITSNPRVPVAQIISTPLLPTACLPSRARKSHAGICMKRNDFRKCENKLTVPADRLSGGHRRDAATTRARCNERGQRDSFITRNITWRREVGINHEFTDTRACTTIIAFHNGKSFPERSRNRKHRTGFNKVSMPKRGNGQGFILRKRGYTF